jgi:endonuclease/exonuclease/phosphatase family protein
MSYASRSLAGRSLFLSALALGFLASAALGQIRVATWNTLDGPSWSRDPDFQTVLSAIGEESVRGIAKRLDVIALQEQTNVSPGALAAMLNSLYGVSSYVGLMLDPNGSDKLGLVYDSATLDHLGSDMVPLGTRPGHHSHFRPTGYSSSDAEFHVYSVHLKAGTGYASRRAEEASNLRDAGDDLGQGAHIIYAGDFNVYSASEGAYTTMLSPGVGKAIDVFNGSWSKITHSQDPRSSMDDRFDHQFLSEELNDGEGLSYIAGTCRSFGNNGTHTFDQPITTGSGASPEVLDALVGASDHLPVVVDYQLPARMGVSIDALPQRVIVDGDVSVDVTISNTADVVSSLGADELDFSLSTSGDLSGTGSGSAAALGASHVRTVDLSTALVGDRSGLISVASDSQAVADGEFSQQVDYVVLDHANASFQSESDSDVLTLDVGGFFAGTGVQSASFDVFNLEATSDCTAALEVTSAAGSGDTSALYLDVAATLIDAGSGEAFQALLSTDSIGAFSSTWYLYNRDETVPGYEWGIPLTLNLTGHVSILGDFNFDSVLNAADIDLMWAALGGEDLLYDLDGDTEVDEDDVSFLVHNVFATEFGDANLDGAVTDADYTIWADSYGSSATVGWAGGDFNGDSSASDADYTIWADQYGAGAGVPEPASLLLLLSAGPILRRRRA